MPPKPPLHSVQLQVPHSPQHHLHSVTIPPQIQYHLPLEILQHQHSELPQHPHPHSGNHRPLANLPLVKHLPQQQVHSVNRSTTHVLYPPSHNPKQRLLSDSLHKEHRLRRLAKRQPLHLLLNLRRRGRLVRLLGHPVRLGLLLPLLRRRRRHLLLQEAEAGFRRSLGNHLLLDLAQARRIIRDRCLVKWLLDSRQMRLRRVRRVCLERQHRDRDLFLVRLQRLAL